MISDDLIEDDILEDDFDIDDDFEDDWDDQGDDIQDIEQNGAAPAAIAGEKSFLQKFFLPIVIAVVVIFGGIFAAGQGLFSSAPNSEQPVYDDAIALGDDSGENITSVNNLLSDNDGASTESSEGDVNNASEEETALTPLPDDSYDEQIELVDLEAELEEDNNILFEDTLELADDALQDDDITEEILTDTSADEDTFLPPVEIQDDINLFAEDSVAQDNVEMISSVENDITAELNAINAENMSLLKSNEMLEKSVSSLTAEVDALTAKLEMMDNVQPPPKVTPSKPAPISQPAAKAPVKVAPTAAAAPSKPVVRKIKWVLRSAQPGKATLAVSGSNDLRTIEIGNVVSGLGKIKSIDIENGRWVVRGTQGNVFQ